MIGGFHTNDAFSSARGGRICYGAPLCPGSGFGLEGLMKGLLEFCGLGLKCSFFRRFDLGMGSMKHF